MTTTAPAPITVRLAVDVAAALRAGHTRAGEVAVAVTPEWLASLAPEEREALAARVGDLRHVDRGTGAVPAREATLDEARRILSECVAYEAQRRAERAAERERERAQDAAIATAVEVAQQTLAAAIAQWAAAPAPVSAADMRAVFDRVGEAALAVSDAARMSTWRLPEWGAVRDLIRARDTAEACAAGTALVEERLTGVEAGTLHWDGRTARAYSVVETRGGVEHVTMREDHRIGHVERALAHILADEGHPLRERVLAVRATAAAQVRAAIEAGEPESLAQYDAGRLTAARIRAIVGYAALSHVGIYPGGVAHREAPHIATPQQGPVSTATWREWRTARDEAAQATRERPWARVVAYPSGTAHVTVAAVVGGCVYTYDHHADAADDD